MVKFLLVAIISLLAAVPAAAPAAPAAPAPVVRYVHFADLDLGNAAGRRALNQRIDAAVRAVCGTVALGTWRATAEARSCRIQTRAAVVYPPSFPSAASAVGIN
jgi:UrcA family protein